MNKQGNLPPREYKNIKEQLPFLAPICFIEIAEIASYWSIKAILVLFVIKSCNFSDTQAYSLIAMYSFFLAAGRAVAAFLTDKIWGFKKMILIGVIVIMLGHAMLFFIQYDIIFLYIGLSFVAIGSICFKGNLANILGDFYHEKDFARDFAFSIFYGSLTLGAIISIRLCHELSLYGWHYSFSFASIFMFCSLIALFYFYNKIFRGKGEPYNPDILNKTIFGLLPTHWLIISMIPVSILISFSLYYSERILSKAITPVIFIILITWFIYIVLKACETIERRNAIISLLVLALFYVVLFALQTQIFSLFSLFADRNVNLGILSIGDIQNINPIGVMVFVLLFSRVFKSIGIKWSVLRFTLGFGCLAIGSVILFVGCKFGSTNHVMPAIYLILSVLLLSLAETAIAPLMTSWANFLSPKLVRARCFTLTSTLSIGLSYYFGSQIAIFMAIPKQDGVIDKAVSFAIYTDGFYRLMILQIVCFVILVMLYPILNKAINRFAATIK